MFNIVPGNSQVDKNTAITPSIYNYTHEITFRQNKPCLRMILSKKDFNPKSVDSPSLSRAKSKHRT